MRRYVTFAANCDGTMANIFEYFTGLRRFHVYSNIENWKPHIGKKISFEREHNNSYHKFAVAGKTF